MKIDNKNNFFFLLIVLFVSCQQISKRQDVQVVPQKHGKFYTLLQKYKTVSIDTLKVFSSSELESDTYPFKGQLLDSAEIELVKESLFITGGVEPFFFACLKFEIDSSVLGLITRVPSVYESSSIKLLLYDKTRDRIIDFIELAETFGDAGDYAEKASCIYKEKGNGFKGVVFYEVGHDNSVDNPTDTTVNISKEYYQIRVSNNGIDTISKDASGLSEKLIYFFNSMSKK